MKKLYFKYGAMGSSKTAQALMVKFNYEQKGHRVFLFKPRCDNRCVENGKAFVASRIGLKSECVEFSKNDNLFNLCQQLGVLNPQYVEKNIVMIDECQFLTTLQVEQLKKLSLFVTMLWIVDKLQNRTF